MEDRRVKELRKSLGLSQERFAHLLGVSLQTVRRWESGLTRPLPIISLKLEELERETGASREKTGGVSMRRAREKASIEAGVSIGGLFKGIGSLVDVISKMSQEGKEEYTSSGEVEALGGKVKGVYGLSIRMGLGGKPVIEQFGNIQETESGPVVAEAREPLVDILDEGDHLLVVAELPGVEEKDIQLKVIDDILELTASTGAKKYRKEILLPSAVEPKSLVYSCRNGVLEIKLDKRS